MKTVAIVQSCYIPWKGYFDLIGAVDHVAGDAQLARQFGQAVAVGAGRAADHDHHVHLRRHQLHRVLPVLGGVADVLLLRRAPYFKSVSDILEPCFRQRSYEYLTELNQALLSVVCGQLQIDTQITGSWNYQLADGKSERLVDLCRQAGATEYISGPAAKDYLEPTLFEEAGIKLTWFDYSGYPEYPQLWGAFAHGVSVLDLLFNCGPQARNYMKLER